MQKIKIILILTQYLSIQNLSTHAIRPETMLFRKISTPGN